MTLKENGIIALLAIAAALSTGTVRGAHAAPPAKKRLAFTGTNLAGAEFGGKPGKIPEFEQDYSYPTENEINYFAAKGMNVFRIPFHWEAMQHSPKAPLVPEELARLKAIVKITTGKGLTVIIDPHNYARFDGKVIGGGEITNTDFADFWTKLAAQFKDDPRVWFGLINEPHDMPNDQWLSAANTAIAAIRKTGAKNLILVPGNNWTGAHSWVSSGNGDLMLRIKDPADHYIFEVHQYLNTNSSGAADDIVSPTIGSDRLRPFVEWCRKHKKRGFLGEFGTAASEPAHIAIADMLSSMEKDSDVWVGFTWWAAGPRWGDYMFSIEPKNLVDRPQISYLLPHLQPTAMAPLPK